MVISELGEAVQATEPTVLRLEDHGTPQRKIMPGLHCAVSSLHHIFKGYGYFRNMFLPNVFQGSTGDTMILTSKLFESIKYLSLYGTGALDSYFATFDNAEEWHVGKIGYKVL